MRALLDANVLLSYLMSQDPSASSTGALIRAALARTFTLLFTVGVGEEIDRKLVERADLARRIPRDAADALLAALTEVAEHVPRLPEPLPQVGRDRKDDYLIAHAVVAGADYLVSWDKDLLDLVEVAGVRIVDPPRFLHALRAAGQLPL
jgi:putative PIN family toxin of toxin-antitoxin system